MSVYLGHAATTPMFDAAIEAMNEVTGPVIAIVLVLVAFFAVNGASIKYMPTIVEANAATDKNIKDVQVTALSWAFQFSERETSSELNLSSISSSLAVTNRSQLGEWGYTSCGSLCSSSL